MHRLQTGKGLPGCWLVGREGPQGPLGQGSVVRVSSHLAGLIRVNVSWHKLNQESSPEKVVLIPKVFSFFLFIILEFPYGSKRILL